MKNPYFTHETIDGVSREMLRTIEKSNKKRRFAFSPSRSALIILDMQKYFLDQNSHAFVPSAPSIVPKIKRLANAFVQSDLPIIFTRHINSSEDSQLMASWWNDLITEDNSLSEIIDELQFPRAKIVKKTQYDGFYKTDLEDILLKRGVCQLVITGVLSHLCCETTARSAFVRGFFVFLPIDGTATYNDEFHRATCLNLSHGFAIPVLVDELLKSLET